MFNNKGFTLIELIIVMVIIAILILLAAPKFMNYLEEAKLTQIKNDVRVVQDIVLLEQGKLLKNNEKRDSFINKKNKEWYGVSIDNEILMNMLQDKSGYQIDPNLILEHTNTKLDVERFFYIPKLRIVFYNDPTIETDETDRDDDEEEEEEEYDDDPARDDDYQRYPDDPEIDDDDY